MRRKYHAIVSLLLISLLSAIAGSNVDSVKSALTEQTLQVIEGCITRSPGEWPDEWRQKYLETIRKAVELHQYAPYYTERLEILCEGFIPCWEGLTKKKNKPLFEVYRARIRWYVEHLMGSKFPTEAERQRLREQYTEIWDYAVNSLLAQFPGLDRNAVQKAKIEELSLCYSKIDTPLLPVYLRPLSDDKVYQIKDRWDKLCYARADSWLQLGSDSKTPSNNGDAILSDLERHYQMTKKSLSQLLGLVWMVVPQRPDYYLSAMKNRTKALKQSQQLKSKARRKQQHLEKEHSRQLLQIEHISFILACLLETPRCCDEVPSHIEQMQWPFEQQDKLVKGDGAYEVKNVSKEK